MLSRDDCWRNDDPKCPFCGYSEEIVYEGGHVIDLTCDKCGKEFIAEPEFDISYITSPKEGWPKA